MKKIISLAAIILVVFVFFSFKKVNLKSKEPWKADQLLSPEELAKRISDAEESNDPVILNIGPSGAIKGSIEIGPLDEPKGIKTLETYLSEVSKEAEIVIYCGCCPFEHCPNIRPAFELLNKKGFKNHFLLDLPKNLKVDWIDKGFLTD